MGKVNVVKLTGTVAAAAVKLATRRAAILSITLTPASPGKQKTVIS